jgi:hypothetical protein
VGPWNQNVPNHQYRASSVAIPQSPGWISRFPDRYCPAFHSCMPSLCTVWKENYTIGSLNSTLHSSQYNVKVYSIFK